MELHDLRTPRPRRGPGLFVNGHARKRTVRTRNHPHPRESPATAPTTTNRPDISEHRRTAANGSEQVRIQPCFPGSRVRMCSWLFGALVPATWYRFVFIEGAAGVRIPCRMGLREVFDCGCLGLLGGRVFVEPLRRPPDSFAEPSQFLSWAAGAFGGVERRCWVSRQGVAVRLLGTQVLLETWVSSMWSRVGVSWPARRVVIAVAGSCRLCSPADNKLLTAYSLNGYLCLRRVVEGGRGKT
jgi:hypothetical protein